jgi:hypothetical protein
VFYYLQHEYTDGEYDFVNRIDVFENYQDAKTVMEDYKAESVYPKDTEGLFCEDDGYFIEKYVLDEDNWVEGFVTDDDPESLRIQQEFRDAGLIP